MDGKLRLEKKINKKFFDQFFMEMVERQESAMRLMVGTLNTKLY
jgi:hypothetical protein